MINLSKRCPQQFLLATVILMVSVGCADDATRIERAQEYRENQEYRAAIIELKNVLRAEPDNIDARTMLGEVSLQNGDSQTAIKELRRAQELGASPDQYAVGLARALLREGRVQEVVKLNPDSLTNTESKAALLALIGMAQLQRGDQPAAGKSFAAALDLEPDQADALIGSARLASERGDSDAAESSLNKVLKLRPDDAESLAALAHLQQTKGQFAQAEENYRKALKAVEGTGRAHERMFYMAGLIEALIAQKEYPEAQAVGTRMIEMSSQHPLALYQAARADYASGNYSGAIDKAERVITVYPTAQPPRLLIAASALAKRDTALAAIHLQAAVDNDPGNEKARRLLASVKMDQGDSKEALEILEPLMAAGTEDAQLLAIAGTANLRSGNQEAGLALMERGMVVSDSDPAVALQAASNFLAAGEINRAIEVLESLPDADKVGQRDLLLILALLRKGDNEGARATAVSIVEQRPESSEAHHLLGAFHLAVGELDQARSEFTKALELDPANLSALIALSKVDIAQQKPELAQARFRRLLDADPGNLLASIALAELAENAGDIEAGVALLEQARTANPKSVTPPMKLAIHYLRAGNLPLAEERAVQAARIAPSNGETHAMVGQIVFADGRQSESIVHFQKAIDASPKLVTAHYYLGRALGATGQADASYSAYKRATEIDKSFFPARAALTVASIERGDFNEAMSIADSLVADYPERAEPLMLRAHVQTAKNDLAGALESYNKAAVIQPSSQIAVRVYEIQKRRGVGQPWSELETWLTKHPDDAAARTALGAAFMEAGLNKRAVENFERVMTTEPSAKVAMTLAQIERKAGNVDASANWLQQAAALDPAGIPARAALAGLELERGDTDAAMKLLGQLRQDHPNAAELDVLEGQILLAKGDYTASISAFDRALIAQPSEFIVLNRYQAGKASGDKDAWRVLEKWFSDHPGHVNSGLQLAQDFGARDWSDEAIEVYRKVLTAEPNNLVALNNIAWTYVERDGEGDIKRGLAAATKAYRQNPENADIADTYGWILARDGQNQKAVEILRVAASGADANPEIIYHYAVVLEAMGRADEAATVLNRALASNTLFESRDDAEILQRRLTP